MNGYVVFKIIWCAVDDQVLANAFQPIRTAMNGSQDRSIVIEIIDYARSGSALGRL